MNGNYWNKLMGSPQAAAGYMDSYGEGAGFELRHEIGSLIKDGESVLDVGCGPGWNYLHFQQHGPEVIYKGLDYSSYMIEGAKSKWPEADFELGDVRDTKQPRESWDVVILQDVLEHTNGYKKPVYEALRVARRRIIITFWHLTEDDDHININPEENDLDGWGAWYSQGKWEEFLNTLKHPWSHDTLQIGNHQRDIYVINKGGQNGNFA